MQVPVSIFLKRHSYFSSASIIEFSFVDIGLLIHSCINSVREMKNCTRNLKFLNFFLFFYPSKCSHSNYCHA